MARSSKWLGDRFLNPKIAVRSCYALLCYSYEQSGNYIKRFWRANKGNVMFIPSLHYLLMIISSIWEPSWQLWQQQARSFLRQK